MAKDYGLILQWPRCTKLLAFHDISAGGMGDPRRCTLDMASSVPVSGYASQRSDPHTAACEFLRVGIDILVRVHSESARCGRLRSRCALSFHDLGAQWHPRRISNIQHAAVVPAICRYYF